MSLVLFPNDYVCSADGVELSSDFAQVLTTVGVSGDLLFHLCFSYRIYLQMIR